VSILRTALRKAQIVTGYVHKCRRQSCGYSEEAAEGDLRRCPKCKMKLWPVGKVIPIRFHDTRHTTASLLMMFGANPAAVQRILRHSDIRVTVDVYGHLAPGTFAARSTGSRFARDSTDLLHRYFKACRRPIWPLRLPRRRPMLPVS
jgi:hypothetical protein